jgi:deoxyribonuclease-4
MRLGVHCSVAGGLHRSFEEASLLNIDCFQIFTRNQQQWKSRPISPEEAESFRSAWEKSGVKTAFSHASYLINLGTPTVPLQKQSQEALVSEVKRIEALGMPFTVLHPGSAKDTDEGQALRNIAERLKSVLSETSNCKAGIALENTAGQGSYIGHRFEHLAQLMEALGDARVGVCFDTCHAFAAGYDLRTEMGIEDVLSDFDKIIGLDHLWAIHLNDSKPEFGSRVDRHDHIGAGKIGLAAFRVLMNRFLNVPKVIETPKSFELDTKNLNVLRSLVAPSHVPG